MLAYVEGYGWVGCCVWDWGEVDGCGSGPCAGWTGFVRFGRCGDGGDLRGGRVDVFDVGGFGGFWHLAVWTVLRMKCCGLVED